MDEVRELCCDINFKLAASNIRKAGNGKVKVSLDIGEFNLGNLHEHLRDGLSFHNVEFETLVQIAGEFINGNGLGPEFRNGCLESNLCT